MNFMKKGRGVLAALLPLALVSPAMADIGGNVTTRYIINDIDKISRDQPAGDNAVNKKKAEAFGYFSHSDYPGWFGGFYAAHEINYRQGFESVGSNDFRNNIVEGTNTSQEIYFGKTYFGDFGELSAELMLGSEAQRDGLKYRPKVTCRASGRAPGVADLYAAVMEGAVERVRAKLMTVVAIMAGPLPILWGSGTGSEVMSRIAAPMVGGMVSSTVLTLVIPANYALVKPWRLKRGLEG